MRLLAIDPGPEESAFLVYDTVERTPAWWSKDANWLPWSSWVFGTEALAIEKIESYGMAVGAEVFRTCVWSGRFIERWLWMRYGNDLGHDEAVWEVPRRSCKLHLCGSNQAKDANIRQALIDRYGPGKEKAIGRKASPGPLYGLTGDCWSALAVAVTASEMRLGKDGGKIVRKEARA